MLVISGWTVRSYASRLVCFNLAIEMLVISGIKISGDTQTAGAGFNLAIEMLVISGYALGARHRRRHTLVSISQSRCLSFQGRRALEARTG